MKSVLILAVCMTFITTGVLFTGVSLAASSPSAEGPTLKSFDPPLNTNQISPVADPGIAKNLAS